VVRRALALLVVGLVVVAGGIGFELLVPDVATLEDVETAVAVNDGPKIPEGQLGDDGAATCTAVGPPPGFVTVRGSFSLRTLPDQSDLDNDFTVVVGLESLPDSTRRTVEDYGVTGRRVEFLATLENEGAVAPGEEATVTVRLKDDGVTVARATETVTAESGSRTLDCE
jgi:hypothetical protein